MVPRNRTRLRSASNDLSSHKYIGQRSIAGEIMENARRVFTQLAKLSIDLSLELTADVLFQFFQKNKIVEQGERVALLFPRCYN